MKRLANEWKGAVGDPVGPTANLQDEKYPVAFSPCCTRFGSGFCMHGLGPGMVSKVDAVASKLNRLVFFRCLRPCPFLVEWLPLFVITVDTNAFWLLMMAARSKSPQAPVFLDCDTVADDGEGGLPVVGTTIKVKLECVCNGTLYRRMAERLVGNVGIQSLDYDWQTLDTLKVTEVKSDISEHFQSSRAEKTENKDKDFELVRDWDKTKLKRKGQKEATASGRRPRAGTAELPASGEELDEDVALPLLGEDAGEAITADAADDSSEDSEQAAGASQPARGSGSGSSQSTAALQGVPGDEALEASAVLSLAQEAQEERDALPVWDPASMSVKDQDTGTVVGSIKGLHSGTPKECVSIYCRLHACSPPLRRIATAPSNHDILSWFRAGQQECPPGKAGREAHLKLFRTMCPPVPPPAR